jgi:hypothetical protein
MQPQGSAVYNPAYLANITQQINGIANDVNHIDPCAAIQALVNEVMAEVQVEIGAIEAQIASLNILITLPTDLGGVIRWIAHFMGPSIQAALNYILQLEQMVVAIASLVAAIEDAASRITSGCSIDVPTPVISVSLPSVTVV